MFWIWLRVLQCDVANQYLDPEEDKYNKAYRPIPAHRITVEQARILRWALLPACLALSACYGTFTVVASILLNKMIYMYDEMRMHAGHWVTRNALNGLAFVSFAAGSALVASQFMSMDFRCILTFLQVMILPN